MLQNNEIILDSVSGILKDRLNSGVVDQFQLGNGFQF